MKFFSPQYSAMFYAGGISQHRNTWHCSNWDRILHFLTSKSWMPEDRLTAIWWKWFSNPRLFFGELPFATVINHKANKISFLSSNFFKSPQRAGKRFYLMIFNNLITSNYCFCYFFVVHISTDALEVLYKIWRLNTMRACYWLKPGAGENYVFFKKNSNTS